MSIRLSKCSRFFGTVRLSVTLVLAVALFGSVTGEGWGAVLGNDVTYTTNADFNQGTLLNVNHDSPFPDQLQLNKTATPFPFVNVAASTRGTTVKIDANTGVIVGEYFTAPTGMGRNPSRTTVDLLGNVWVANRDEAGFSGGQNKGSVARIGLIIGGTRVNLDRMPNLIGEYLAPPFQYNTCVDRNGDGLFKTSRGLGHILPWTNAGGADTHGGVLSAEDECIINYTRVVGTGTRTVAVDAHNDLWTGGVDTDHEKVDGVTGLPVPGTQFNLGCGGYGGLIDRNGVLWSARFGTNAPLRFDTQTMTGACLGGNHGDYGLGIDPKTGEIWHTYLGGGVAKLAPNGNVIGVFNHGNYYAQGVAVDGKGNVWVAHSLVGYFTTVGHLKTDGTFVGNVSLPGGVGPTGVAIDANGKIWVTNYYSSNVMRIDPAAGPIGGGGFPIGAVDMTVSLGDGANPYNYSDMTGFVAIGSTSPQGVWSVVQDSGKTGNQWGTMTWNQEPGGSEPAGTGILVEARAADSEAGLSLKPYLPIANGISFTLLGQFIETRITLKANAQGISPILSDIKISGGPLTNVRVIDTISTANIDLDQTTFSKPPVSITPDSGNNKTLIEWQFDSFSIGQIENLSFDIILKNPVPGEDRLVNHKLELLYTDVNGKLVRTELGPQFVHVLTKAVHPTVTTDKARYTANENVLIDLSVINLSEFPRTVDAVVTIEDSTGNLVQTVRRFSDLAFATGEIKAFPNLTYNTGKTFAGDYRVHARLMEAGKQVGEAFTNFAILPVRAAASTIVSDKVAYNANESVTLTSAATSLSPNNVLNRLEATVKVTDAGGASVFSETRALADLLPEARMEFKSFTNTGTLVAGLYTATLYVRSDATPLTSATTTFETRSSLSTGAGLKGTLDAFPNPVRQGVDETLTYTVTNSGNADQSNLPLTVLVVDPNTAATKATFPVIVHVSKGEAIVGNVTASTINLAPAVYLAILQAHIGGEIKTLASTTFKVLPGLEVKKEIPDFARVLVWIGNPCKDAKDKGEEAVVDEEEEDADEDNNSLIDEDEDKDDDKETKKCVREDLVTKALNEIGITYKIVTHKKEFRTELRNNFYTDYLVFGKHPPLQDRYPAAELTEKIFSGRGLIASFAKMKKIFQPMGIVADGKLHDKDPQVEFIEGPIFPHQILQARGKVIKIKEFAPDRVLAWITDQQGKRHPAVIKSEYGLGKSLFFAFDLGLSLREENFTQVKEILRTSLNYIHRTQEREAFYLFDLVPIDITVKSLGTESLLKITESYPSEIRLFDPVIGQWITDNPLVKEVHLNTGETKVIRLFALMPDKKGLYTLTTDIVSADTGERYQRLSIDISVVRDIPMLIADILRRLETIPAITRKEIEMKAQAIKQVQSVRDRKVQRSEDIVKNIRDILKAIQILDGLAPQDDLLRLDIDRLLTSWEEQWYLK